MGFSNYRINDLQTSDYDETNINNNKSQITLRKQTRVRMFFLYTFNQTVAQKRKRQRKGVARKVDDGS